MVCKYCNGKPDTPGNYSQKCRNCDGAGTLKICSQCFGSGITQTAINPSSYKGQDKYEVVVHWPGENALVVFDCSRCRKSGVCEDDKEDCATCGGKGIFHRPCTASYHLDEDTKRANWERRRKLHQLEDETRRDLEASWESEDEDEDEETEKEEKI